VLEDRLVLLLRGSDLVVVCVQLKVGCPKDIGEGLDKVGGENLKTKLSRLKPLLSNMGDTNGDEAIGLEHTMGENNSLSISSIPMLLVAIEG